MNLKEYTYSKRNIKRVLLTKSLVPIDSSFINNFWKETLLVLIVNESNIDFSQEYKNYFYKKWLNILLVYWETSNIKEAIQKSIASCCWKEDSNVELLSTYEVDWFEYLSLLEVKESDFDSREKIIAWIKSRNSQRIIKDVNCWNIFILWKERFWKKNIKFITVLEKLIWKTDSISLEKLFVLMNSWIITSKEFLLYFEDIEDSIEEDEISKQLLRWIVSWQIIKKEKLDLRDFSKISFSIFDKVTIDDINDFFFTKSIQEKIEKTELMNLVESYTLKTWVFPIFSSFVYFSEVLEKTNSLQEFFAYTTSLFRARVIWWNSYISTWYLIEFLRITRNYYKKKRIKQSTKQQIIDELKTLIRNTEEIHWI